MVVVLTPVANSWYQLDDAKTQNQITIFPTFSKWANLDCDIYFGFIN